MSSLKQWWTNLVNNGPKFGYFLNVSKFWLVVKAEHLEEAKKVFAHSQINATKSGRNYLGAPLGDLKYCHSFKRRKVTNWIEQLAYIANFPTSCGVFCFDTWPARQVDLLNKNCPIYYSRSGTVRICHQDQAHSCADRPEST